ncbi:hypothetical protein, partial [Photobacterium halotolerans]|uniref:hypothetical protein n=1 Tax=Photobacterium halotolerans TaxID=265726 RepID=UPI001F1796E7
MLHWVVYLWSGYDWYDALAKPKINRSLLYTCEAACKSDLLIFLLFIPNKEAYCMNALEITDLNKVYPGVQALKDMSLT